MANLFIDPVETKKMSLFLRYQTTVQREYDKSISEFKKAKAEREKQQFEQALLEVPRQRTIAVGFASQNEGYLQEEHPDRHSPAFTGSPKPSFHPPTRRLTLKQNQSILLWRLE